MRGFSTASGNSTLTVGAVIVPTVGAVIGREEGTAVYQADRIAPFAATDRSYGIICLA